MDRLRLSLRWLRLSKEVGSSDLMINAPLP
jgi:hypothetical protein